MAKFWNFVFFQAGWFACVLGAANKQVFWAVLVTLAYIAFTIWRDHAPKLVLKLLGKVLVYGIVADTIIMHLGYLNFQDDWPSPYLSPLWMWVLWVLVGGTINGSLSWLRGRPVLGFILGLSADQCPMKLVFVWVLGAGVLAIRPWVLSWLGLFGASPSPLFLLGSHLIQWWPSKKSVNSFKKPLANSTVFIYSNF